MENFLYTHIDTDGISCAIVAFLFGLIKEPSQVALLDYKDIEDEDGNVTIPLFEVTGKVYYTDLHIDNAVYTYLTEHYGIDNVLFFDHHSGSMDFDGYPNVYVDTERCGTKLLFDHLRKGKRVPAIWDDYVTLVDVYDRWLTDHPMREQSEDLNRVLFSMANYRSSTTYQKYEQFINYQLAKLREGTYRRTFPFTDFERHAIELAREKEDREYHYAIANAQERVDSAGHSFMLWHGASKISYVCNRMLTEYPHLSYVVAVNTWNPAYNKREINGKLSVRSPNTGDFDCTELCGIEGHTHAAGGQFDPQFVKSFLLGRVNELGYKGVDCE